MDIPSTADIEQIIKYAEEKINALKKEKNNSISNYALWDQAFEYVLIGEWDFSRDILIVIPPTIRSKDILSHFITVAERKFGAAQIVLRQSECIYSTNKVYVKVVPSSADSTRGFSMPYCIFGDKDILKKHFNMVHTMINTTFITIDCDSGELIKQMSFFKK